MIDYVSCRDRELELHTDDRSGIIFASDKAAELAAFARRNGGFADVVMGSSTMDFASEEGFDTDDCASLLLKRVFELV
tara:strand:+ start:520 stop:753 length:234 start_codon:yes stop_codon:yes gene_type:complete